MSKVSIVIPVWNIENELGKCIESILSQTYKNFELILINDGTEDNSFEIMKKYQKKDKRIRVYSWENHGVAKTRNWGIELAKGKYLMFIDGDDYVDHDYVETLVKNIKNNKIVISGYKKVNLEEEVLEVVSMEDNVWSKFKISATVGKLYELKFLKDNHLKQPEDISIGEDLVFNIQCYSKTPKIKVIPYTGYNYLQNPKSATNTIRKYDILPVLKHMNSTIDYKYLDRKLMGYFYLKTVLFTTYLQRKGLSTKEIVINIKSGITWIKDENFQLRYFNEKGEVLFVKILLNTVIICNKLHLLRPLAFLLKQK